MKHTRITASLLVFLLCSLFSGCGITKATPSVSVADSAAPSGADSDAFSALLITDMRGREVTLDAPAERIVALTAADCEIVYALGCGDRLVGRGAYCDYPAEVLNVPEVESGSLTNVEQIIALNPDVLLMGDMDQSVEQVSQLSDAGIKVFVSDADTVEGTFTAIHMIGQILGRNEEADTIINGMKSVFDELRRSKEPSSEKTVYFEVSPLEWGLWAAGTDTFMDEIAEMIGLKNCFSDVTGWCAISEEQVLERNPDYIVTVAMYFGEGLTPEEEIRSRPGWENLTAIKNGAILNMGNNELTRPGPRLSDGAKLLFDFTSGAAD